jgi:hypothetical protein
MSGVSRNQLEPSPDCACRKQRIPQSKASGCSTSPTTTLARGSHVTVGIAMTALFCAASGLISPANAQLFGSSYTSTAPRNCRVSGVEKPNPV